MKKIRTKRGLLGTLMIAAILGTGCNTEQSVPELYVDDNIRETPVTAFTENIEVSKAIEERCKAVLNQDGNTNIAVYSDSADYYAALTRLDFPLFRRPKTAMCRRLERGVLFINPKSKI